MQTGSGTVKRCSNISGGTISCHDRLAAILVSIHHGGCVGILPRVAAGFKGGPVEELTQHQRDLVQMTREIIEI